MILEIFVLEYLEVVEKLKPEIFIIENVKVWLQQQMDTL